MRERKPPGGAERFTRDVRSSVRLHVRRVGEATGELFLTGAAPASEANAVELYEGIARALSAHRASVFLERAHAPAPLHDALRAARARALGAHDLDPGAPSLVLAGGDSTLSVQLWAAAGSSMITVSARGLEGRLRDGQLLWLPGIAGREASRAGARQMLEHAESALGALGFGWSDVARTWIVLRRLLEWYGEMNGARTAFLTARGIGRDRPFPASTGVLLVQTTMPVTLSAIYVALPERPALAFGIASTAFVLGVLPAFAAGAPSFFAPALIASLVLGSALAIFVSLRVLGSAHARPRETSASG